jgi:hypothetical protein
VQAKCDKADIMPLMLELKYEYFPATWPGRIKLLELVLAFFCIVCSAPAYWNCQHWFLFVVVVAFLGSIFFSLYYLCLAEPLNKLQVNWLMVEFWFTAVATFGYFTAFIAMLVDFAGFEFEGSQYWVDANIAAAVFGLFNTVVYGAGAYLIYIDWKANPTGATAPPPPA